MTDPVILTFDIEKPCHMSIGGAGMSISEKDFEEGLSGLLKMLKSNSAKATFFIVAELVERHLNIFRQIAEEGHEIGLHSFYHKLMFMEIKKLRAFRTLSRQNSAEFLKSLCRPASL